MATGSRLLELIRRVNFGECSLILITMATREMIYAGNNSCSQDLAYASNPLKKQTSNPISRFNQATKTVGKLGAALEWIILSNGAVTLAKKIIALIIPSATVIILLRTKSTVTSKIPAMRVVKRTTMNNRGQWLGQDKQYVLPRERLRFGPQAPHSIPLRLCAHCASDPDGRLKFMLTFLLGG